jgi:hypothetical protein
MDKRADRIDWRLLAAFFAVTAIALILRSIYGGMPLINDTDDAMRLIEVRDFLSGQNWYDLTQYRLDAPYGASMHWSRLVDLPIAAIITALGPFFGAGAETIAAYVYPLLMLLGLLWLSAKLAMRFAGPEGLLPGLALPAFSMVMVADFPPGRFDHHSAQILLLLAMLLCTLDALQRPRRAIWAGIAAAAAIAIGIESLPSVVSTILAFGLLWVLDGRRADALRWFGLSFAVASLAFLAVALPPSRWFAPMCDAISIVYAVAAVGTGIAFVGLSLLELRSLPARLVAGAIGGAVLVGTVVTLFPDCLRGPYAALDPWLVHNWLDRIEEAKPAFVAVLANPIFVIAVGVPALLAVAVAAWQLVRAPAETRPKWLAYAAFLAVAVIVAVVQVRAARMASSLAVPAGAVLIASARAAYLRRASLGNVLGLVGSWIGFAGLAIALITGIALAVATPDKPRISTGSAAVTPSETDCRFPAAFTTLAALPRSRIMAPIDLGAHLLLYTPHAVVAAPYHRNQDGIRDTFRFLNDPIDTALQIAATRGIGLVVICPGMPELRRTADTAPDSFISLLRENRLPDWLTETTPPGATLRVFSVTAP